MTDTHEILLDTGEAVHLESGRDYYWKRSGGFVCNGRERHWEYYINIYPGMNGGGGIFVYEKARWNGSSGWTSVTPRNLTYSESRALLLQLATNQALHQEKQLTDALRREGATHGSN